MASHGNRRIGRSLVAFLLFLCVLASSPTWAQGKRELRKRYWDVVDLWARGQEDTAVRDLVALDMIQRSESRLRGALPMEKVVGPVARKLVRSGGVRVLLPLSLMHERSYVLYLQRQDFQGAARVRAFLVELLATFANEAGSAEERRVVASLLTSLAGRMGHEDLVAQSIDLYRWATTLDPQNVAALLALATSFERLGDHDEVAECLTSLLRLDPDHREARLRLAVSLLRRQETEKAAKFLEALVQEEEVDWVAAVAHQEWARLLSAQGRWAEANLVVERMTQRRPGDPTLWIQYAYIQDRLGLGSRNDLAATLAATVSEKEAPARREYLRASDTLVEGLRQELAEIDERWREDLVLGLEARN